MGSGRCVHGHRPVSPLPVSPSDHLGPRGACCPVGFTGASWTTTSAGSRSARPLRCRAPGRGRRRGLARGRVARAAARWGRPGSLPVRRTGAPGAACVPGPSPCERMAARGQGTSSAWATAHWTCMQCTLRQVRQAASSPSCLTQPASTTTGTGEGGPWLSTEWGQANLKASLVGWACALCSASGVLGRGEAPRKERGGDDTPVTSRKRRHYGDAEGLARGEREGPPYCWCVSTSSEKN